MRAGVALPRCGRLPQNILQEALQRLLLILRGQIVCPADRRSGPVPVPSTRVGGCLEGESVPAGRANHFGAIKVAYRSSRLPKFQRILRTAEQCLVFVQRLAGIRLQLG